MRAIWIIAPLVAGCVAGDVTRDEVLVGEGPADARPDACYSRLVEGAVFETVTVQEVVSPEVRDADGVVTQLAVFREEVVTREVSPRRLSWFETPCAARGDAAFVASVQRALAARGLYGGAVDGVYDAATADAVQAFQAPLGIDSGIISNRAAVELGLLAVGRGAA
ncbi:peptidoglycan-binding protein [Jannaschia sp. Os4]|uniref:peptidoglycan-binding domain-containing protein n=1 Tax=Jannaschia sp. Os4 TaxID=2807617 RepID=UPI00193967CF|nr:peptidoglycan-binding domain-containing protein [Jannaschia sp. Os4]MBM2574828.1 peptidoglycan-binding protein [Jannaschia sp. Os4]